MVSCPACGRELPGEFPFCPFCAAPLSAPAEREQRKTVTVLFCDVTGSTELGERLDPEALRALLARYFEQMKQIVEHHGGSVEKFIGDAVMAVFGVPVVHEDDALRALRAAVEMRESFPELGIQGRIGVTTGEVVTGTAERLATGDAVNVAARLEQAAKPGEILIGMETLQLARDAAEVEPLQALELKGKAEPLPAYRLLSVEGGEGFARHLEAPMVGRGTELRRLGDAFGQALDSHSCQLFTILGAAGVGKSRLAAEFLDSLEGTLIVRGRCLPYGEGITYWPVVEVVKQLPQAQTDSVVADTIGALLGEEQLVSSSEEIAWAFRKLLEAVASETPVVCVFDDIHWGEETFLDLIEHVADLSRDAPILLLCMARPDLLDRRTGWAGGKVNATSVLLEPLEPAETEQLIESLAHLDESLRARILEAAEGNPLYVEEMVSFVRASGGGEITVPPTIQALLAARLDQLDSSERTVLERGAVEGRIFHRGAVQALSPEEPQVLAQLTSLVRKELVRPDRAQLPGEDAFRFRHLLIRDAAYDALPKAVRAELHERFADWLTESGRDLVELDEILGYHLEQSTRYRQELGSPRTEHDRDTATRGAERLCAAGERALVRRDRRAGANLLRRGLALLAPDARPLELEWKLALALMESGDLAGALKEADELAARGAASGDRRVELYGLLVGAVVTFLAGTESMDSVRRLAEEARAEFEATADELGIGLSWLALAHVHHNACRWQQRHQALEHAHLHGVRARDAYLQEHSILWMAAGPVYGPMPTDEGLRWFDAYATDLENMPVMAALRAVVEAMVGNFDGARTLMRNARSRLEELGQHLWLAGLSMETAAIEMLAGDPAAAAREAIAGCQALEAIGERGWLSTIAGQTAHALLEVGRDDEAEHWIGVADATGSPDDVITQTLILEVRAKLCSRRGNQTEAKALARAAVDLVSQTDMLEATAASKLNLAGVLQAAGSDAEAIEEIRAAVELYERKRHLVGAARARTLLESARLPA